MPTNLWETTRNEDSRWCARVTTGSKSRKRFVSYEEAYDRPFDDMRRRVPCLQKLRSKIEYKPGYDLPAIIDDVISYMKG